MENHLLNSQQAADYLNVNLATLLRLAYAGEIASVKMGNKRRSPRRFRRADLEAFVTNHLEQRKNEKGLQTDAI